MQGRLHPSLRTYIDCFLSPPFPKHFPRSGGLYDQDPMLMRDFRQIREFELSWKESQQQLEDAKRKLSGGAPTTPGKGAEINLEELLDEIA